LFTTALAPTEILIEIRVPVAPAKSGGAYRKLKRKTGDFAAAAVAVQLTLNAKGAVERAGIALTNAGPTPIHAVEAEKFLAGKTPSEEVIAKTASLAATAGSPSADRRGSVEYKREMARVLAGRALKAALERAGRA
jgi:carbon-monoxide dehydrogenase medium subunit